ncbi:MAG: class I SAM-dependent methyltransferase [Desulfobacterales bacterium]|nr:class I SAM-dependent methyltransferase [Desulfobacterales bacterium]
MPENESSKYLEQVYSASDNRALKEAYDQWSDKYDAHVTGFGYQIPAVASCLFGRYVAPDTGPFLDAGTGTGLMGEMLDILGYQGQVAIDLSKGMLARAAARGVYTELREMVLGEKLDFADNHFGACQSIGVFTAGHAPASAFDELVRIVRPGGHIVFSLMERLYEEGDFKEKLEGLETAKKWTQVARTRPFPGLPLEDPDLMHQVFVYRVL